MDKLVEYYIQGCANELYPTEILCACIRTKNESIGIFKKYPFSGSWGKISSINVLLDDFHLLPQSLEISYFSITEIKIYTYNIIFDEIRVKEIFNYIKDKDCESPITILVGMAPYGYVTVWLVSNNKSIILSNGQGVLYKGEDIKELLPEGYSIEKYGMEYLSNLPHVERNIKENGLPHSSFFQNRNKQFLFRYLIIFEKLTQDNIWEKYKAEEKQPKIDYIQEILYDGTYDKLNNGDLLKYNKSGKPKNIKIQYYLKNNVYNVFFWIDEDEITILFDRFYGTHPETKSDFIIRIDAENKKYELALFRFGLKEPQLIPETDYQVIVFKNQLEDYRSPNYNQPRGAWIW